MNRSQTAALPLSRREILTAAVRVLDSDGFEAVTVRRVAADLDVTPMALYRHVGTKDDLMLEVADVLLGRAGIPDPDLPWIEYLTAFAVGLRRLFATHPALVEVFARRAVVTSSAKRRLEASIAVGTAAGLDEATAINAYAAVHTYTLGFCALEAGRRQRELRPEGEAGGADPDPTARVIEGFVSDAQFTVGLTAMLSGLASAPHAG